LSNPRGVLLLSNSIRSCFNHRVRSAFDIAVVGSGFSGSIISAIARQLGRSVVLLEKSQHPRFAIGESSTPLANLILDQLCQRYGLSAVQPLAKWGTWQKTCPDLACGLKRGFSFYHHSVGAPFKSNPPRTNELLVAASPTDAIADTHWYRSELDHMLVREAQKLGVVYLDEVELWGIDADRRRPVIQGRHKGRPLEIHASFVLDASGPRGFLHRALELPEIPFKNLPNTQALYSHFRGVKPWSELHPPSEEPPFPPDDAAMHHVFDGGWMWVLRFNNGMTSAGIAASNGARTAFGNIDFAAGQPAWQRMIEKLPAVQAQFARAELTRPFVHSKQLGFLSGCVSGPHWALLPSAAGFVDPLLSTGFPLALLGVERLAHILETNWGMEGFAEELFRYSMQTTMELVTVERLVGALYANMGDFELFSTLTLLYFAAASYSEAARRLGTAHLAGQTFLLCEHPGFGPGFRYCLDTALRKPTGRARKDLINRILQTIEPVNIAGLGDPCRHHWYPALADDLLANAHKLQSSPEEVAAMLRRCGFW
jgi:FADH2 O2-dependent halogenase